MREGKRWFYFDCQHWRGNQLPWRQKIWGPLSFACADWPVLVILSYLISLSAKIVVRSLNLSHGPHHQRCSSHGLSFHFSCSWGYSFMNLPSRSQCFVMRWGPPRSAPSGACGALHSFWGNPLVLHWAQLFGTFTHRAVFPQPLGAHLATPLQMTPSMHSRQAREGQALL